MTTYSKAMAEKPVDMTRPAFLANLAATLMRADCMLVYEVDESVVSDVLIGGAAAVGPDGHPDMAFEAQEVRIVGSGVHGREDYFTMNPLMS